MFKDLGRKIQLCAYIITLLGIIASFIYGIFLWSTGMRDGEGLVILFGLLAIVIGSLASWLSSFLLYGFGIIVQSHESKLESEQETTQPDKTTLETFWECYYCGAKLYEKSSFCPECGKQFKEDKKDNAIDINFLNDALSPEELEQIKNILNK